MNDASQEKFAIKQINSLIFLLDSKIQMVCCMEG